jgi:peptide/nickel transport system permease protein
MIGFLLGRAAALGATLALASVLIFICLDIAPGDPAAYMMGLNADPTAIAALRAELGLDAPPLQRYVDWIAGLARGDFGVSYTYRVPVADLLWERAQVSAPLAALAFILSAAAAFAAALFVVARRGTIAARVTLAGAQAAIAAPNFWLALLLALTFSAGLGWFSAGGFPGWSAGVGPALHALILPAFALAAPQAAILMRVLRASLMEALNEDYVRTARAKGASPWRALTRHALPNALLPALSIMGLQASFLIAGAVVIETVFYLPGLGRLAMQAIAQRDLIVVRGVVMALVFASVVIAFIVDVLYALADPRLRRPRAS